MIEVNGVIYTKEELLEDPTSFGDFIDWLGQRDEPYFLVQPDGFIMAIDNEEEWFWVGTIL